MSFIISEKLANNGKVRIVERDNWSYSYQMITLTGKLTNLKYELPLSTWHRDTQLISISTF